jgi:hypothetical protein
MYHPALLKALSKYDSTLLFRRMAAKEIELNEKSDYYDKQEQKINAIENNSKEKQALMKTEGETLDNYSKQIYTHDLEIAGELFMRDAPIVFEGKIIKSEQCFNQDSSEVRHSALIQVTRVIRGQEYLKVGFVELQTESGYYYRLGKNFLEERTNFELPVKMFQEDIRGEIFNNNTQLFFSKVLPKATPHYEEIHTQYILQDYKKLSYQDYCSIQYIKPNNTTPPFIASGLYHLFVLNDYEQFIVYLAKYGLDIKEKPIAPIQKQIPKPKKQPKRIKKYGYRSPSSLGTLAISTANKQITTTYIGNTPNNFLEFDIMAKVDAPVYVNNHSIYIKFDPNLFGWFTGRDTNRIKLTLPSYYRPYLIANATPIRWGNDINVPTDTMMIQINKPSNQAFTAQLSTTEQVLVHVKFKFDGCASSSGIDFVKRPTAAVFTQYAYQPQPITNPSLWNAGTFSTINYITPSFRSSSISEVCATVFDFSPKIIHGGAEEILTIRATQGGFGTTKGTVIFTNGETLSDTKDYIPNNYINDATAMISALPSAYILSWTDTLIKVYVPSNVNPSEHAGSGLFKVVKADGTNIYSTAKLNIRYSYFTQAPAGSSNQRWQRFYIPNQFCYKGLGFGIDSTGIWRRPAAAPSAAAIIKCIGDAAAYWSRTIGGDSIHLKAVLLDPNNPRRDLMGKIIFVQGLNPTDIGTYPTAVSTPVSPAGKKNAEIGVRMDIALDRGANVWFIDSTLTLPKAAGKSDFFCVLLHEFGHSLGLLHSYDITATDPKVELMRKVNYNGGSDLTAAQRMTPTTGKASARDGIQRIVRESYALTWRDSVGAYAGQFATLGSTGTNSSITTQPFNQLACVSNASLPVGSPNLVSFSLTSAGTGNYYQWQTVATNTNNISRATANSYTPTTKGYYKCLVSKEGCTVVTNTVAYDVMPIVTMIDSLNKCTIQPIALTMPSPLLPPFSIAATGIGVTTTNGQVYINPSVANAGAVTWTATNPAQVSQAEQFCTTTASFKAVNIAAATKIKTCPIDRCIGVRATNITGFTIAFLDCYKTGTSFALQLSKPDGTFNNVTNMSNIAKKIIDFATLPSTNTFNLIVPSDSFPASGSYKVRVVINTPSNNPAITYSAPSCSFVVTKVVSSSDCPQKALPQVSKSCSCG